MGVPNEAQSDTVKAVRAMQDADRAGALQPTPLLPGWGEARTVHMLVSGDELRFEIIRAESGEVERIVDVLADGGLRIRPRCGENAPAGEEGAPEWLKAGMLCTRWEGHEPPHRVARKSDGPFFDWQDTGDAERRDPAAGSEGERWRVAAGPEYVEDEEISRVAREFGDGIAAAPLEDARRVRARQEENERPQRELSTYAAGRDGPYAEMYGGAPPWPGPRRWVTCPECGMPGVETDSPCTNLGCPSHERRGSRAEERMEQDDSIAEVCEDAAGPQVEEAEMAVARVIDGAAFRAQPIGPYAAAVERARERAIEQARAILGQAAECRESEEWPLRVAAARELLAGEPEPAVHHCRFEAALRKLVE